jgi:hypothetical protein
MCYNIDLHMSYPSAPCIPPSIRSYKTRQSNRMGGGIQSRANAMRVWWWYWERGELAIESENPLSSIPFVVSARRPESSSLRAQRVSQPERQFRFSMLLDLFSSCELSGTVDRYVRKTRIAHIRLRTSFQVAQTFHVEVEGACQFLVRK